MLQSDLHHPPQHMKRRLLSQSLGKRLNLALLQLVFFVVFPVEAAKAASLTLIADGFDNVRGLAFDSDGSLYVTEQGGGSAAGCSATPIVQGQPVCVNNTGAISRIRNGQSERILSGLPSLELAATNEGAGPKDIKFDEQGNAYLLYGYAGNPVDRQGLSPTLGQLYRVDLDNGSLTTIADLAGYEQINNPDGGAAADPQGAITSNPNAFTIVGEQAYVVDSGGNSLYTVDLDGSNLKATALPTQTVSNPEFPPADPDQPLPPGPSPQMPELAAIELQSVPTGVAIGPDGAAYIGEFSGFPFPEGEARILRVGVEGEPTVYATGFTQLSDLEFDSQGNLFALQFADQPSWKGDLQGSLIRIASDGTRSTVVKAGEGLEAATALAIGPDDTIYISNRGAGAGIGQVLRVEAEAVPEPSSILGAFVFGSFASYFKLKRKRQRSVETA